MEEADGHLKKVKDRTLPLMVPTNVTAGELLKAATAKHWRHFKQFNSLENYFLLYPDQTVVDTLLGSAKPFILNWYKEELGKPFSKLYFWLSSTRDMDNLDAASDSESVSQDHHFLLIWALQWKSHSKEVSHKSPLMALPVMMLMQRLPTLPEETVPVQPVLGYFLWRKLKCMLTSVQTLGLTL